MAKNRINKICREVLSITEEEFKEMYDVANGQLEYSSPMKPATSGWQHQLGEHNIAVLDALRDLKHTIEQGANIQKP